MMGIGLSTQLDGQEDDDEQLIILNNNNAIWTNANYSDITDRRLCYLIDENNDTYQCMICKHTSDEIGKNYNIIVIINKLTITIIVRCSLGCIASFCKSCIEEWIKRLADLNRTSTCPSCRNEREQFTSDNVARGLINEKQVYCVNAYSSSVEVEQVIGTKRKYQADDDQFLDNKKCCWRGQYGALSNHLKEDCSFELIHCTSLECTAIEQRQFLTRHLAICEFVLEDCQDCGDAIRRKDLAAHDMNCVGKVIICECGTRFQRKNLRKHREFSCPLAYVECPIHGCCLNVMRKDLNMHADDHSKHVQCLSLKLVEANCRLDTACAEIDCLHNDINFLVNEQQQHRDQQQQQHREQQQHSQQIENQLRMQLQQVLQQVQQLQQHFNGQPNPNVPEVAYHAQQHNNNNNYAQPNNIPRIYLNFVFHHGGVQNPIRDEVRRLGAKYEWDRHKWYTWNSHANYDAIISIPGVTIAE